MELKPLNAVGFNRGSKPFNRTLWNWNDIGISSCLNISILLIVPYGIETNTFLSIGRSKEPFNRTLWNWNGIIFRHIARIASFNRALWNWNTTSIWWIMLSLPSFNRTLWNWNSFNELTFNSALSFNRTLWNWNHVKNH